MEFFPSLLLLFVSPLLQFVFPAASILPTASAASPAPAKSFLFHKDAIPTQTGYLPVAATSRSAMYFAYYEAQQPQQPLPQTPLLVWLQGGPGCSSLLGNFFELGPWLAVNSTTGGLALARNPFSWNRLFGLLFLDNPIGTGFSVAADPSEIPRDQDAVAAHLWTALQAFLSSNPSFRSRPLYLAGESYAGKYVPAAGYHILRRNSRVSAASRRINLLGVAIGNGLTHPVAQVATHADSVYFTGLINDRQKAHLEQLQSAAVNLTVAGKWAAATDARNRVLEWMENATGLATLNDVSKTRAYGTGLVDALLKEPAAKAALGVDGGAEWDSCSGRVEKALHEDVMKSTKGAVEGLLGKVRVLLYQGQNDLRDGVVSTEAWLRELEWEGLEGFLAAERKVWRLGGGGGEGVLAGYVQSEGWWLSEVVVAGAGHLVPADRRESAQVMIESWVTGEDPFLAGRREDAKSNWISC